MREAATCPDRQRSIVVRVRTHSADARTDETVQTPSPASLYLLIFRDSTVNGYRALSPEERQHLLRRWNEWFESLLDSQVIQGGNPVDPEGRVISGMGGSQVDDKPFSEGKETISGYFVIRAGSLDEATAVGRECPNLEYGMTVEVRPVGECCRLARTVEQERRNVFLRS